MRHLLRDSHSAFIFHLEISSDSTWIEIKINTVIKGCDFSIDSSPSNDITSKARQKVIHHSDAHPRNTMTTGYVLESFKSDVCMMITILNLFWEHVFSFSFNFMLAHIPVQIIKRGNKSMHWIHIKPCQGVWGPVQVLRLNFVTALLCEQTESWSVAELREFSPWLLIFCVKVNI